MVPAYGRSGVGRVGPDRRRTRARSVPTGWQTEQGEVTGQELEFENGYRVLAVTIPGLKATIKGADAWKAWMQHLDQCSAVIREWIDSEERNHKGRTVEAKPEEVSAALGDTEQRLNAMESKIDKVTNNLDRLIEAISQKM